MLSDFILIIILNCSVTAVKKFLCQLHHNWIFNHVFKIFVVHKQLLFDPDAFAKMLNVQENSQKEFLTSGTGVGHD